MSHAPRIMERFDVVRPAVSYAHSFLAAVEELPESYRQQLLYAPWSVEEARADFPRYVATLLHGGHVAARDRVREGMPFPSSVVPETVLWGVSGDEFLGRIAFRHTLNDFLRTFGGHVGFAVRPSARGQGVASEMLRRVLASSRARALGRVLLTCDEDNTASRRIIEKHGGIAAGSCQRPGEPPTLQFWITTS